MAVGAGSLAGGAEHAAEVRAVDRQQDGQREQSQGRRRTSSCGRGEGSAGVNNKERCHCRLSAVPPSSSPSSSSPGQTGGLI
ncbi:unnamed protein product [Urochloa humidicola]